MHRTKELSTENSHNFSRKYYLNSLLLIIVGFKFYVQISAILIFKYTYDK
jgi:hypothetical protein